MDDIKTIVNMIPRNCHITTIVLKNASCNVHISKYKNFPYPNEIIYLNTLHIFLIDLPLVPQTQKIKLSSNLVSALQEYDH